MEKEINTKKHLKAIGLLIAFGFFYFATYGLQADEKTSFPDFERPALEDEDLRTVIEGESLKEEANFLEEAVRQEQEMGTAELEWQQEIKEEFYETLQDVQELESISGPIVDWPIESEQYDFEEKGETAKEPVKPEEPSIQPIDVEPPKPIDHGQEKLTR